VQRVFALTYAPVTDGRAAGFSKGFFDHQSSGHRKTPLFATNARWASEIEEGAIDESESGMLDKNYFGPVYPEAPKFKDPQDDLLEIGIASVSSLRRVRLRRKNTKWYELKASI